MVKNLTGGKHKNKARKHMTAKPSNILRVSKNELEVYAQVCKLLGNGMCHVNTLDNRQLLCHIRGKFRGRGKRDNFIKIGSWLLVGLRDWEMTSNATSTKLNNCDLLEVYTDNDKEKLKMTELSINWRSFITNDNKMSIGMSNTNTSNSNTIMDDDEDGGFDFMDEQTQEYYALIEKDLQNKKKKEDEKKKKVLEEKNNNDSDEEEEEIDIDDI